jgi:pimeloyl-ACP methyl ester carboxylesterase
MDPTLQKVKEVDLPQTFDPFKLSEETPKWFEAMVAYRGKDCYVTSRGCKIHYLRYGSIYHGAEGKKTKAEELDANGVALKPGLVFIHGGGAHAHWWDFIAPSFLEEYTVIAIDLGGMGESENRDEYDWDYPYEVLDVIAHAKLPPRPIVVGHSFGGFVTLTLAQLPEGRDLGGIVVIDSPIRPPDQERGQPPSGKQRIYGSSNEALSRFVLMPPQKCSNNYILNYIAGHSIKYLPEENGWSWKFDPKRYQKASEKSKAMNFDGSMLKGLNCRLSYFYGDRSVLVPAETLQYMKDTVAESKPGGFHHTSFVKIAGSGHHLMLDQPIGFTSTLHAILQEWKRSDMHSTRLAQFGLENAKQQIEQLLQQTTVLSKSLSSLRDSAKSGLDTLSRL